MKIYDSPYLRARVMRRGVRGLTSSRLDSVCGRSMGLCSPSLSAALSLSSSSGMLWNESLPFCILGGLLWKEHELSASKSKPFGFSFVGSVALGNCFINS